MSIFLVVVKNPPAGLNPNGKQWFRRTYATLAEAQRAADRVCRLQGYDAIAMEKSSAESSGVNMARIRNPLKLVAQGGY